MFLLSIYGDGQEVRDPGMSKDDASGLVVLAGGGMHE